MFNVHIKRTATVIILFFTYGNVDVKLITCTLNIHFGL